MGPTPSSLLTEMSSSNMANLAILRGATHRVGRVLSFFSSRWNWDSPNPSPARECAPPPFGTGGEGHTHWRDRGWESPNSNEET
jgi:hypothetical protein